MKKRIINGQEYKTKRNYKGSYRAVRKLNTGKFYLVWGYPVHNGVVYDNSNKIGGEFNTKLEAEEFKRCFSHIT